MPLQAQKQFTLSRMLEVLATSQMREIMDTLCMHDTFATPPEADIIDCISSYVNFAPNLAAQPQTYQVPLYMHELALKNFISRAETQ